MGESVNLMRTHSRIIGFALFRLDENTIVLLVMALAYTGFFLSIPNPPFIDAAAITSGSRGGSWIHCGGIAHSPFQGLFSASRVFVPYITPDLGLIVLVRTLGIRMAYPVWGTLTVLVLVLGIWAYAREVLDDAVGGGGGGVVLLVFRD